MDPDAWLPAMAVRVVGIDGTVFEALRQSTACSGLVTPFARPRGSPQGLQSGDTIVRLRSHRLLGNN